MCSLVHASSYIYIFVFEGLGSKYQPELARAAAYASGRYGHVIFPENVHDAVLECSKKLLATVGMVNEQTCRQSIDATMPIDCLDFDVYRSS